MSNLNDLLQTSNSLINMKNFIELIKIISKIILGTIDVDPYYLRYLWIIDISLVIILMLFLFFSIFCCVIRSLSIKFEFILYMVGVILFIGTYFLIRETSDDLIPNDGAIAIFLFIIMASAIIIRKIYLNSIKKDFP